MRFLMIRLYFLFGQMKLLGQMLYYVLTTGSGQQTLGEEYCDIIQVFIALLNLLLSVHTQNHFTFPGYFYRCFSRIRSRGERRLSPLIDEDFHINR